VLCALASAVFDPLMVYAYIQNLQSQKGHAAAQAVSRRRLTEEARVGPRGQYRLNLWQPKWQWDRLLPYYCGFPLFVSFYHPLLNTHPHLSVSLITRTSGRNLGTFQAMLFSDIGEIERTFEFFFHS
jgi:hypothetical protein